MDKKGSFFLGGGVHFGKLTQQWKTDPDGRCIYFLLKMQQITWVLLGNTGGCFSELGAMAGSSGTSKRSSGRSDGIGIGSRRYSLDDHDHPTQL